MPRRVVDLRPNSDADAAVPAAPTAPRVDDGEGMPRRPGGPELGESERQLKLPRRARRRSAVKAAAVSAASRLEGQMTVPPADQPVAEVRPSSDEMPVSAPARARKRRPDPFGERLLALEREIDEALARAGGTVDGGMAAVARAAAEELLAFYADLARAFVSGGVGEAFTRLRMIGTAERVDDFGYDPTFYARIAPVLRFLHERWWRIELSGADNVPLKGRVLLVANHSGGFFPYDGLMVAHALREHHPGGGREVRPLIEDFSYHLPFLGPLLARAGAVRASAENAERLLLREQALAVFPEGAKGIGKYYRERYRLQRFGRGGFVTLAIRMAAPLVPVAVIGGEEIHPVVAKWQWLARLLNLPYFPVTPVFPWFGLLGLVPLPTKWRIVFGAPIDLAAQHGAGAYADDLLVNRLREQVRERIQRMLIEGLRARDSVFAG
jgi:1-acyl-sn-glycerol-3-phosphate acyltransferase